jgi:ATP-dependent protease Clp ATPase subunit
VAHLIASPTDYPRAYICDECVEFCHSILGEIRSEPQPGQSPKRDLLRLASHIIKYPKCGEAFDWNRRQETAEHVVNLAAEIAPGRQATPLRLPAKSHFR